MDAEGEGGREPMFRAPWPPVALAAVLLALFAVQALTGVERSADAFGLTPDAVAHGRRLFTLLTSQLVHLSWMHAGLNALAVLAFGAGPARLFGARPADAALFLLFCLGCGVVAGLAEAAAHPHGAFLVVGASGAASGLVGAVSRMVPGSRRLLPFASRQVAAMAGAWVAGNLALGWAGMDMVTGGAPIAWEAHLGGYAAGLLAIGPFAAWSRRSQAG